VDAHPGITLADLRKAAAPIRSEHINITIAQHALYVDLSTYRLTEPEHTPFSSPEKQRLPILPPREDSGIERICGDRAGSQFSGWQAWASAAFR